MMTRISALKYGVAAVWLLALSTAEAATYTFESLTSANSSIAQPTILLPTINNKGAVAYYDRRIGGFVGGIVIDTGNSSVVHILNSPASPFEAGRGMPINDLGAVLVMRRTAASSGSGFNTLQRINADGTTTTLATFAADGSEDLKANNSNSVYGAFNNAGQAAF